MLSRADWATLSSTRPATLIRALDMHELEVPGLQGFLVAKVFQTLGILYFCHANGGTSNLRQFVGPHL